MNSSLSTWFLFGYGEWDARLYRLVEIFNWSRGCGLESVLEHADLPYPLHPTVFAFLSFLTLN